MTYRPTYEEWHATTSEGRTQARVLAEMRACVGERQTLPWWRPFRRARLKEQCNVLAFIAYKHGWTGREDPRPANWR